jgi:hypothetical protein
MYVMQTYSIQQFCIRCPEDQHHPGRVQPFYVKLRHSITLTSPVSLFMFTYLSTTKDTEIMVPKVNYAA